MGQGYEVDTDELRTHGNDMLRAGDALRATAGKGVMLGHGSYGGPGADLRGAAWRFADRFTYAVHKLGDETESIGHAMRMSALSYDVIDTMAADDHKALGDQLP